MSEPIKTMPEVLAALKEMAKDLNDDHAMCACCDDPEREELHQGESTAYYDAWEKVDRIIARIESGQAQAEQKEVRYEDAWERMIKALTGMRVEQIDIKDNAIRNGHRDLSISLNGTIIAIESMLEEMQAIQARIEAGE